MKKVLTHKTVWFRTQGYGLGVTVGLGAVKKLKLQELYSHLDSPGTGPIVRQFPKPMQPTPYPFKVY